MPYIVRVLSAVLLATGCCAGYAALVIDADFPGGNIRVGDISNDTVHLQPDLRGTDGWWFYWCFRVRGGASRRITIQFDGRSPIGARGPAVSLDGQHWSWLGIDKVRDSATDASFSYDIPVASDDVRFAFCPPYVEADWQRFAATLKRPPEFSLSNLCDTEKHRHVELVHITPKNKKPAHCVLLTARHHACEAMASYVLEGVLAAICGDDATGFWLRDRVEFYAVPFMDKDGVEEGDQGKNRPPHDHWLDYSDGSRYRSVAALKELVSRMSRRPTLALDLHCSYLREASQEPGCSEQLFFMESMNSTIAAETGEFQQILRREQRGRIRYDGRYDLPFGVRWNNEEIAAPSFLAWASNLSDTRVATVFELPYANAGGVEVTAESSRQVGRDLAVAMKAYFEKRANGEQ